MLSDYIDAEIPVDEYFCNRERFNVFPFDAHAPQLFEINKRLFKVSKSNVLFGPDPLLSAKNFPRLDGSRDIDVYTYVHTSNPSYDKRFHKVSLRSALENLDELFKRMSESF
ncbi:hypothetical protein CMI38_05345 [Candidatus Pacearchaeota archaeon]|jgi:hypothetical protein|nr:hypothetical protein [Candidatus Pacearchaeota archaeon]|tara:strand:- start:1548 stop:1883 length:336 start_codon:yes stop_codon:yes gene_type:complete